MYPNIHNSCVFSLFYGTGNFSYWGRWMGTTLGNLLATKGYQVKIWSYEQKTVDQININHENKQFLPNFILSQNLHAYNRFEDVIPHADILIFAVPSGYVRAIAEQISPVFLADRHYKLVTVSKGLEYDSFKLMSEVLREVLTPKCKNCSVIWSKFIRGGRPKTSHRNRNRIDS